jgi:formate hydrogenlyase subunit 3/multisubunit Na+/H+ antiporter MnhD subunit
MTDQAGTGRLDRLGGLIRGMPAASAALAASLLALSAVPPAADFAAVWLLFQAILSAPRTGGLVAQLPLALSAAALAFSAALATAACLRLIGVAVLSRPRGVRASAADDVAPPRRWVLLAPAAAGLLIGVLPGPVLRLLADPAIRDLTGAGLRGRVGWTGLAGSAASQGYDPLPLLVLVAVAAVAVSRLVRRRETRVTAGWTGGAAPSRTLPFGEPLAQSAGLGFAPTLPDLPALRLPGGWTPPRLRVPAIGLWVLLLGFGALLLSLAGTGG